MKPQLTITVDLGQPDEAGLDAMIDWIADQIAAEMLAEAEAPKGLE